MPEPKARLWPGCGGPAKRAALTLTLICTTVQVVAAAATARRPLAMFCKLGKDRCVQPWWHKPLLGRMLMYALGVLLSVLDRHKGVINVLMDPSGVCV